MPAPGLRLSVLAGPTIPVPLPAPFAARLRQVTVSESDEERSAFSLTFDAGRSGPTAALDTPMLLGSPVGAFFRVCLMVTFGMVPQVLMDGIVTQVELRPGEEPGSATLVAIGEDVTFLLDQNEADTEHPAMDDLPLVYTILARYASRGIAPLAVPPPTSDPPLPIDRVPTQHDTDLGHLLMMAERHGYVCYASPGPAPGVSTVYWGPPVRAGLPQRALSVDLGPETNVSRLSFRQDAIGPVVIEGEMQDPATGESMPVRAAASLRPPLAAMPLWAVQQQNIRKLRFRDPGTSAIQAFARAQGQVDAASDAVVAEGELDGARYGEVLRPRGLVGMRGAGWSHDGLWYVKRVDHELAPGSYTQSFTLAREGYGSTVPVVMT
jgi:hypothetical protein